MCIHSSPFASKHARSYARAWVRASKKKHTVARSRLCVPRTHAIQADARTHTRTNTNTHTHTYTHTHTHTHEVQVRESHPPQAASRRQWRKWRARTTTGKGYSLPRPPSGRRLVALSLVKKKRRVRLELHSIPATIHAGLSQSGLLVI